MSAAAGTSEYTKGRAPCMGNGYAWSSKELDDAIDGPVTDFVFDVAGKALIANGLKILAVFDDPKDSPKGVRDDLTSILKNGDWKVGEAIGHVYLAANRKCLFPWPPSRDARAAQASLPGADLVGFCEDDKGGCLVFGEIKTSAVSSRPPSVVHGENGLTKQMERLRDQKSVRKFLAEYLLLRVSLLAHAPISEFLRNIVRSATARFTLDDTDVQLFGFLVRDVDPDERDLSGLVETLCDRRPKLMKIELLALYLPAGRIEGMGARVASKRAGDSP